VGKAGLLTEVAGQLQARVVARLEVAQQLQHPALAEDHGRAVDGAEAGYRIGGGVGLAAQQGRRQGRQLVHLAAEAAALA
jgi:hypothetical protein